VTPTVQISSAPVAAPFSAAFTSTLNGYTSGGLGGRAPFLPLASVPVDQVSRIDARLTKYFPITDRMKAAFTFDAFNVFNHRYFTSVNARAYVATNGATPGTGILTQQSALGVGTASQGFPDGTNARRLQIGLRFNW
jgi:hypothetical protein